MVDEGINITLEVIELLQIVCKMLCYKESRTELIS